MSHNIKLDSDKIVSTLDQLEHRISERFPNAGLRNICAQFIDVAKKSKQNIEWITKANLVLRFVSYLIIALGVGVLIYSLTIVEFKLEDTTFVNMVTIAEAVFNDIILLGAAIFFLASLESRMKRRHVSKMLNELRVLAHVIDMHQLTKDPNRISATINNTENSPQRTLSKFELERYLEYSAELLALLGKVAVLYAQSFPDDAVLKTVHEIEILTTGLSRKIWQKMIVLNGIKENFKLIE